MVESGCHREGHRRNPKGEPIPETSFINRFLWALTCARAAWLASWNGMVVVPIVFTPDRASQLVGSGIDLAAPVSVLAAQPAMGGWTLHGFSEPDPPFRVGSVVERIIDSLGQKEEISHA